MFNEENYLLVTVVTVAVRAIILTVGGISDRTSPYSGKLFTEFRTPENMKKFDVRGQSFHCTTYSSYTPLLTQE